MGAGFTTKLVLSLLYLSGLLLACYPQVIWSSEVAERVATKQLCERPMSYPLGGQELCHHREI